MTHQTQVPPPPPSPYGPYAGNPMKNALGVWALVLGILTLVFAWVPFAGFGSYATGAVGLVLGIYGIRRANHHVASNRGVAIAGTVLSALGLLSVILATVVYSALLYAASTADTGTGSSSLPSATSTLEPSKGATHDAATTARIGQKVRDGKFEFTVIRITHATHVGGSIFGEDAQGRYTIVQLRIKNIGSESQSLIDGNQYVYDAKGRKFSADSSADIALSGTSKGSTWFNEINPGNTVDGKIAFDMPKKDKATKIELHDSMFSDGVVVSLR